MRAQVPALSGAGLVAFGAAFAVLNAASEELAYRGALQHALEGELGPRLGVLAQGVAFGAPHFEHGFRAGGRVSR